MASKHNRASVQCCSKGKFDKAGAFKEATRLRRLGPASRAPLSGPGCEQLRVRCVDQAPRVKSSPGSSARSVRPPGQRLPRQTACMTWSATRQAPHQRHGVRARPDPAACIDARLTSCSPRSSRNMQPSLPRGRPRSGRASAGLEQS